MELTKKYYKIKEVAEFLNIPASTLRYWESQFTIIKPKRNEHGTRFYTPADVEKIRMVYFLVKEKGLKLEAAEEQIRHNHSGVSRKHQAIERLRKIRTQLQGMLDALHELR
ncbi:MAG: MerR family transcriptional regulator [Muribaculaceae bacterium]|nr:MerR family transcriptional regulator [Muribaculaceae bacterium]MBQ7851758.1 MerR family transcriptional regulator [Muribaculaceae bacterium]MBR1964895.1 MerR family transcriptional regulator [Muribaculaceae bacterium]